MATETGPKPPIKERPSRLNWRVRSLLDIYEAVFWETELDVPPLLVQSGKIGSEIAIASISWGTQNGQIQFLWLEDQTARQKPEVSLIETTGGKYVQVAIPNTHLNELEKEIKGISPECNLPYFFLQANHVADSVKKIKLEKRMGLPAWELIRSTISKIYEFHLEI